MWVLSFVACGSVEREGCDRLVVCATVVNPFLVDGYRAVYDEDGTCWDTFEPEECEAQCEQVLTELYVEYEHDPACDPVPVTGEPLLTEGSFWADYNDAYCDAYVACGGMKRNCYERGPCSDYEVFDPLAARACIAAPPVCSGNDYGSVIEGSACDRVCDG